MKTLRQLDRRDTPGKFRLARGVRASAMAAVCLVLPFVLYAIPVPALNLDELTEKADLIVAGELKSLTEAGEETLHRDSGDVQCRVTNGTLLVSESLKGRSPAQELGVQYCVPEQFIGWAIPKLHMYAVFFLSSGKAGTFSFTDPYYPFVIAVRGPAIGGNTPIEGVVAAINAVVFSKDSSKDQKLVAVFFLSCSKSTESTLALRSLLAFPDKDVRLRAAEALLARNDPSGLAPAADALASPNETESKNVMAAIAGGLRDPKAIPSLEPLLKSPNPDVRRAAVSALRNTHSPKALSALASRLDDPDREIRYVAVIGLAEITRQNNWRPSIAEFKENEEKFLRYWKDWAQNAHLPL